MQVKSGKFSTAVPETREQFNARKLKKERDRQAKAMQALVAALLDATDPASIESFSEELCDRSARLATFAQAIRRLSLPPSTPSLSREPIPEEFPGGMEGL